MWQCPVQFSSVAQSCLTLCDPMNHGMPGLHVHHQLLEYTQMHVHWVGDVIQPSHPLSSPSPPALNLSQLQGLFNESALCIRWPKYWSFSFNISPSSEHPGLISFRMHWVDLLVVQGTLKSLLQHHSSKASVLRRSAFFIVQLSRPYMTTGKTIALTRQTFVDKVMSLLFNILSRLLITFLPRSKRLLISWLQSPSAVILEPPKIKPSSVDANDKRLPSLSSLFSLQATQIHFVFTSVLHLFVLAFSVSSDRNALSLLDSLWNQLKLQLVWRPFCVFPSPTTLPTFFLSVPISLLLTFICCYNYWSHLSFPALKGLKDREYVLMFVSFGTEFAVGEARKEGEKEREGKEG